MNPIKFLKKTLIVEMGFAAAPAIAGFGSIIGTSAAAALPVTAAATGLVTTVGAATAATGLFGGASLLSTLSQVASVGSTLASIGSTVAAGEAQSRDIKIQAKAEEFNARNREIERKRNLVRSLALQNVRAGASGITSGFGSSAQAIQLEDISRFELDQSSDAFSTTQRVNQLKQNASNATTFSLLSAGGEAARFGLRAAKRGTV